MSVLLQMKGHPILMDTHNCQIVSLPRGLAMRLLLAASCWLVLGDSYSRTDV